MTSIVAPPSGTQSAGRAPLTLPLLDDAIAATLRDERARILAESGIH
jgi:hypothetical protein